VSFTYDEPDTLDEATRSLLEYGDRATPLAGGTILGLAMKEGQLAGRHVVGLKRLSELRGIRSESTGLWIGASSTHRQVERSSAVLASHSAIARAFTQIAHVRVRNQGTIGGNIAHGSPTFDPPPILIALGASLSIAGTGGTTRISPLDGFFRDVQVTELGQGELIVGVHVPVIPAGSRSTYLKFHSHSTGGFALVSVAASIRLDGDGKVASVRVVLGSVHSTPIRSHAIERALLGRQPTVAAIREAAALVREEIDPIADVMGSARYKTEMARVWTERALLEVVS
jgi:carbon-monoxide dehydrogenase medium subunit